MRHAETMAETGPQSGDRVGFAAPSPPTRVSCSRRGVEPARCRRPAMRPIRSKTSGRCLRRQTVAVLGASTKDVAIANTFIRRMKAFGYDGAIYPIHPTATEIEGLQTYPDLASTPEIVDYAYVAIGARAHPGRLADAKGRCRIAQVISSGFGEVEEGKGARDRPRAESAARRGAGARPQLSRHLFAARQAHLSLRRTTGSRLDRHRIAVGRPIDRHHQARPVARRALQRAGDDRQQRRRQAARAARPIILPIP